MRYYFNHNFFSFDSGIINVHPSLLPRYRGVCSDYSHYFQWRQRNWDIHHGYKSQEVRKKESNPLTLKFDDDDNLLVSVDR